MKKFKVGLSLLMSLIMVFSVFSFGAFAATDTEIDTIALDFNAKPGDSFEDWKNQLAINTDGVTVSSAMEELGVGVFVIGEDEFLTGTYEMGETYLVTICLETKDGYSFPDSSEGFKSVTVNGEPAEIIVETVDVITVSVTVTAVMYELVMGGTIDSVDASLNVYGDMAVADWYRYLKVNSQGVEALDSDIDAVRAYDKNGNPVIGEFVTGEEYSLEVYLSAKKNCEFKKNDAGEVALDSAKLNGNDAAYTVGTYQYEGTQYEYLKFETTVTAKEPKYITSVDITVSENLEGMPVAQWKDYVTINTPGLKFLDDYASVEVYDYFGNFVYDSFEEGDIYNIFVYITPEEGYFFPHHERLEDVKINGKQLDETEVFYYENNENGEVYMELYTKADMVGDGIWAQIMFFFKKVAHWFQNLFFGFILF
ncbi:MAG: hypothetical protein IKK09_12460 [Clostridia bacterium]|nr:hypothetical protein [Clostridia bacterium]